MLSGGYDLLSTGRCVSDNVVRLQPTVSHLLVVHVAGAPDECRPAFGVKLQRRDAVSSVPLSRDLWSQNLQAVPWREACEKQKFCENFIVNVY